MRRTTTKEIDVSEWQPIETAPRDGSWFVTANAREPDGEYEVSRFNPWMQDQYVQEVDGRFRRERVPVMEFSSDNFHRATHWMPLEPPHNAALSGADRTTAGNEQTPGSVSA
jgi:hypothetical protein